MTTGNSDFRDVRITLQLKLDAKEDPGWYLSVRHAEGYVEDLAPMRIRPEIALQIADFIGGRGHDAVVRGSQYAEQWLIEQQERYEQLLDGAKRAKEAAAKWHDFNAANDGDDTNEREANAD